jgi:DNA damage-inducible protein 1
MDTTSSKSSVLSLSVVFDSDVRLIEVESDETIENIKAILEVEYNLPLVRQVLSFEGKILDNSSRLSSSGVKNNDMLMLDEAQQRAPIPRAAGGAPVAPGSRPSGGIGLDMLGNFFNPYQRHMREAEELLQLATVDPHLRRRISENNASLAAALESNNAQNVAKELAEIHRLKAENEAKKNAAIMRLNSNPLDVEAQREIEEAIHMENIDKNLEQVLIEHFVLHVMLGRLIHGSGYGVQSRVFWKGSHALHRLRSQREAYQSLCG